MPVLSLIPSGETAALTTTACDSRA